MKKILVTTLVLSIAVVSNMDARPVGAVAGANASVRQITQDIKNSAADLKAAPRSAKQEALDNLMADLQADPKMADLAGLEIKRKKIVTDLEEAKAKMQQANTGWFSSTDEYKKYKQQVADLGIKLKDVNKQIASVRKELPKESFVTVRNAVIGAAAVVGIAMLIEYWYSGEKSYTEQYVVSPFREKGPIGSRYKSGRDWVSKKWYGEQAPAGTPQTPTTGTPAPAVNPNPAPVVDPNVGL